MNNLIKAGIKRGDKVVCKTNGEGIVRKIKLLTRGYLFPIQVIFPNGNIEVYTADGCLTFGGLDFSLTLKDQ